MKEKPTEDDPVIGHARDHMVSRRSFLAGTVSLAGLAATTMMIPRLHAQEVKPPEDPMRVPGALPRPYGDRSPFVKSARVGGAGPGAPHDWAENTPNNFNSWTPFKDLHGILTRSSLHFERHHNGVPLIDPARHRLLIHGLVNRPMIFSLDDLELFPAVSRIAFLECSGNSHDLWLPNAPDFTVHDTHGLTGTSEWTGAKLSTLLEAVGVHRGPSWMAPEGSESAGMDRG